MARPRGCRAGGWGGNTPSAPLTGEGVNSRVPGVLHFILFVGLHYSHTKCRGNRSYLNVFEKVILFLKHVLNNYVYLILSSKIIK